MWGEVKPQQNPKELKLVHRYSSIVDAKYIPHAFGGGGRDIRKQGREEKRVKHGRNMGISLLLFLGLFCASFSRSVEP